MRVKEVELKLYNEPIKCAVCVDHYENGRLAISIETLEFGEPMGRLTVNMPDLDCGENEIWLKDWAENEPWALKFALCEQIVKPCPVDVMPTGYINIKRYALDPEFLRLIGEALKKEIKR